MRTAALVSVLWSVAACNGVRRIDDDPRPADSVVRSTFEAWHRAAAVGDFDAYFSRMTDDAVFLGTDRTERWTRDEFEDFARPYFDGEEAWTYRTVSRNVTMAPLPERDPFIAWVDEILWNDKYGHCRGTGMAVRQPDRTWRIHRYSLSFLVPNEKSGAVMDAIGPQSRPAVD